MSACAFRRLLPLVALAGCNQTNINTPTRSFDRPSDVALTCVGVDTSLPVGSRVFLGRPLEDCTPDNILRETVTETINGAQVQTTPLLRALVVNSTRGELAMVDINSGSIVDLDPQTPGFGFLPVGKLPEHVRASADGCIAVTTNSDSCDLSRVDLPTLYNLPFLPFRDGGAPPEDGGAPYGTDVATRLVPTSGGRPLGARPSWIEISGGAAQQCGSGAYRAWVALPGCQLVAELDLSNGKPMGDGTVTAEVIQAMRVTREAATPVADPTTLSCPSECGGPVKLSEAPDTPDAGAALLPTSQAFPGAIALDRESGTGRLFIGDLAGERIYVVPLDANGVMGAPRKMVLETGALGVSVLRASPRSQAGKFLYAVARDGSVRVIDLDREQECETNPDPRAPALQALPDADPAPAARSLGCFPLGDPATPPRSPLATSPGIQLPGSPLPRDVAFVHLDVPIPVATNVEPPVAAPSLAVGDFAWIISSDGRGTLINIYDACPAPNIPIATNGTFTPACDLGNVPSSLATVIANIGAPQPLVLERVAHHVRNGTARFAPPTDTTGTPRLQDQTNPTTVTVGGVAPPAAAPDGGAPALPSLVNVDAAQGGIRYLEFFDPGRARNETWTVSWEGLLPGTTRSLGRPRAGQLTDPGGAWCTRGVRRGDKLYLNGCNSDSDCDFAQSCVRDPGAPVDVTSGLCLDRGQEKPQAATCGPLLRALRRYRITSAEQGVTVDGVTTDRLALAEIYEPEYAPETHACASDADCNGSNPALGAVTVPGTDSSGIAVDLPTRCLTDFDGVARCLRPCGPELAVDHSGSGAGTVTPGRTNPSESPETTAVVVHITASGPTGTSSFEFSVDGGAFAAGGPTVAAFAVPNRNLTLRFAGDFTAGDSYRVTSTHNGDRCGTDFECATSRLGDSRCLRAPLDDALFAACLKELQPYELHAGDGFLVSGSLTGVLIEEEPDPATGECVVPPVSSEYVRLHQSRIPLVAAACPPSLTDPLGALDPSQPNVCALPSGLHFENPFFSFVLGLSSGVPADQTALSFVLVGGGSPLSLGLGTDVQAQQPRAAVTAPDRDNVFVVDEGKQTSATGLRGQLLKLTTSVQSVDRRFQVR
jgi:hypothetical protein